MSNAYILTSANNLPPSVATEYHTDVNSPAIPSGNVLVLSGGSTSADGADGIRTFANPMDGNEVIFQLTNRQAGTANTSDGSTNTIINFNLGATPGVYYFSGSLVAFNTTDTAGASYAFESAVRTTGAAGIEIGTEDKTVFEDAAMMAADFNFTVSGNFALLQVTGIAGKTIHWEALLTFTFVS